MRLLGHVLVPRSRDLDALEPGGWRCRRCRLAWNGLPDEDCEAHGTIYGYNRLGCRCDECRRANTEKQRAYRANHNRVTRRGRVAAAFGADIAPRAGLGNPAGEHGRPSEGRQ